MNAFHYAFKIKDIASTRTFYVDILNCKEGRSTENWIDFEFFGHQLSGHVSSNFPELDYCGKVDGIHVPIPHFGCLLTISQFEDIQQKLEANNIEFVVKPQTRYKGQTGEQRTMFVFDYSGNPLEFKAFSDESEVFASN
ncbi:VOC family protein [Kordia algicida OT-1]|uniref:Predicted dioxygenase of extradiol dioxygenase family protein n=1 Tax=Kordia algicida OT-1 TaxID=391587 RepID=A9E7R4_9FLAO|nr:VOC family protein [Kordia algicida]EDP94924.1 predicted dioxygenase of extradiol dioxygenase family protein [Kordia algicida OT-1]